MTFTSADRVRDVIHHFNADGFDSLYPKYKGGRPRMFTAGGLFMIGASMVVTASLVATFALSMLIASVTRAGRRSNSRPTGT